MSINQHRYKFSVSVFLKVYFHYNIRQTTIITSITQNTQYTIVGHQLKNRLQKISWRLKKNEAYESTRRNALSKIEGVTWETEQQNCFYRKSNLSDEKWEDFNCDFQESLQANIPSPHLLCANSLANFISVTYKTIIDKYMPLKKRPSNFKFKEDRPWITSGLKTSIKKMYELLKISKQSGSIEVSVSVFLKVYFH